jgi:bifunctional enzyme CysN/CysC
MTTLLRFLTCGSVDDGKSTLVGRLLHDAGVVPADRWTSVVNLSEQRGKTRDLPDFSLLLDALADERSQGITIDVAWRYFRTPRRQFVMADSPGHEQYTRNMVTAASQCDMALLLVDARKGTLPQTRRHAAIVWLLGIQKIVMVSNKMDLVDWGERTFTELQRQFLEFSKPMGLAAPVFIPVSALHGDNVVHKSERMPWYTGASLLDLLETADVHQPGDDLPFRFPVQWINRAGDFRGYSGTVVSGCARLGDAVNVLPSGVRSKIREIITFDGERDTAATGDAVTIALADDVDVARGDVLVAERDASAVSTDKFGANVVWMDEQALLPGRRYELRLATTTVPATVKRLIHRLNLETTREEPATRLEKNHIGRCEVITERPVQCDLYSLSRHTGGFILVDRATNRTAGAGMLTSNEAQCLFWEEISVDKAARAGLKGQKPHVVWFTGLSGAGKSTIANAVEQTLFLEGFHTYLIDGDNVRHGLSKDLGFGDTDRIENTRRVGELAKLMVDAGLIVLVSLISPFRTERRMVREILQPGEFLEVYVSTPLEVCESRDRKGLYRRAREGRIQNFTGISSPYEPPERPELNLDTSKEPVEGCVERVLSLLRKA